MSEPADGLRKRFGDIDVYLFDQLLRGRIVSGMRVLDAGCGSGRNLIFLMRAGFDVWGVDESEEAIAAVQRLATELTPRLDERCNLERRAALRARRQPLDGHGPRDVESARAGRHTLCQDGDHGGPA
jgi:SAM-dependent methyltransferase